MINADLNRPQFVETLLAGSVSKVYSEAVLEWKESEGFHKNDSKDHCICGQAIVWKTLLTNIKNGNTLIIGQDCAGVLESYAIQSYLTLALALCTTSSGRATVSDLLTKAQRWGKPIMSTVIKEKLERTAKTPYFWAYKRIDLDSRYADRCWEYVHRDIEKAVEVRAKQKEPEEIVNVYGKSNPRDSACKGCGMVDSEGDCKILGYGWPCPAHGMS